jgi:hypothetical protein
MKKCVLFIDTRQGQEYIDVINQHMKHLKGWELIVGTTNEAWNNCYSVLGCKHIVVEEITSQNDYNYLLTDPEFWQFFMAMNYSRILFIQHDSGLLKNNMNDFIEYDYVGAPWTFQEHGGNGGLSLRNPVLMYSICINKPYNLSYGNEDVYFCNYIKENNYGKLAPRDVCGKFAMEVILQYDTTGYHAIDKYHDEYTVNKIKSQER